MKYYEINENNAKQSKAMWSFSDYINGVETENYQKMVDNAYKLCEKVPAEYQEKAQELANKYAYILAQYINEGFIIELACPSIMICGAGNFPIRKKEKQNERRNKHIKNYEYIEDILNKINNLETYKPKVVKQGTAKDIDFTNDFFKVIQNEELNRLQLKFDRIPAEDIRTLLKSKGFKWSPKNQTWQRQLTVNAIYSTKSILRELRGE